MKGPSFQNLNQPTPKKMRLWANLVLAVGTVLSTSLVVTEHPAIAAVVASVVAGARVFVEFYSTEDKQCQG